MTDQYLHRKPHRLDVHLASQSEAIQQLTDDLLGEISSCISIQSRRRSREALKKVLLNLIHNEITCGCIRYSRNKNDYALHRRYGRLWLKYDRLIPLINALIELEYVESLNGSWNKEKKFGLQSKIWSSPKFIEIMIEYLMGECYTDILDREEPDQLIQMKNEKKKLIQYDETKSITRWRDELKQYNRFINEQDITVNLTEAVMVDNKFWIDDFLKGLLDGNYKLSSINLNSTIQDLISPTSMSTHSTLFSTILNTSTLNSTFTNHLQCHLGLSSTKEELWNPLTDKALTGQDFDIRDGFLNYLICLNKAIKSFKKNKERKELLRVKKSLGDLGISNFDFTLKYKSLHRVFNDESFDRGGRFYGSPHINLPGHMRGFIHINGDPVIELDYDSLHPSILYNLKGKEAPEELYEIIPGPELRKVKKKALLTAINAPTDIKAVRGIRRELIRAGYRGDILKDKYLKDLLARTKNAHPDIIEDISNDKGKTLQNIDSRIANNILAELTKQKIPTLPEHDSFVVPEQYEDELRYQMKKQYKNILGFEPGVSKKKKKYDNK